VTGTNGKTTVTLLMADMLDASGLRTVAAGNIGTALSDVAAESWDVVVVEASSFQLRFVETFHPAVSVVLNVVEDHLDWHGSFHAYLAAKANIARNADPNDPLVYDFDDVGAAKLAAGTPAQPVPVSGLERPGGGWGPESGTLVMPFGAVPMEALPVRDPAFLLDQVAAGVAAHIVGAVPDRIVGVLQRFSPSNHRRTVVGEWDGVTWIDDSKATNPHAAIAAVRAYESVVLIAGGRNKGLDLSPLVHQPNLRGVIAIGEAAAEIAVAAPPGRVTTADSMDDAVVAADGIARPGDVVLLAPGCASFDMFDSYAERGDRFAESVRRAKEGS
jgi:UDP-N-acetylmuramoylalanine--D-glutamate ligase